MAQRAYRQRKESTLEELRKRVSDLSNTIEVMNKLFSDCRDRLYASNLNETQMFDLHDTASELETLVKEARNPNEDCEFSYGAAPLRNLSSLRITLANAVVVASDEAPKPVHRSSTSSETIKPAAADIVEPKNVPSWLDQSVVAPSFNPKRRGSMEIGLGYSIRLSPENEDQTQPLTFGGFEAEPMDIGTSSSFPQASNIDSFDMFHAEMPDTLSLPGSLSPPMTYSFQETSIARRIHRACAEAAYQLILDPRRRPTEYERIFKLTLMGRDREKIAKSLKHVLDRGPHEDLDFWGAPLIHIGGAGTHYARRDAFGNIVPRKQTHNVGIIGPQTYALLENAQRDQITTDMTVQLAGFEGEWFDPYDVQGYLEEKGIFIDPTSSFAEAEIIEWGHTSASGSTTSSHHPTTPPAALPSPGRSTPLTGTQIEKMINEADADLTQWNEFSNMQLTAVGYSDAASGSWMNFMQPGEGINPIPQTAQPSTWEINPSFIPQTQPATPQPKRKNVFIDVSKFVKGKHDVLLWILELPLTSACNSNDIFWSMPWSDARLSTTRC